MPEMDDQQWILIDLTLLYIEHLCCLLHLHNLRTFSIHVSFQCTIHIQRSVYYLYISMYLLYKAFYFILFQELCLSIIPTFANLVEYSSIKNALVPRIRKLCLGTSVLGVSYLLFIPIIQWNRKIININK